LLSEDIDINDNMCILIISMEVLGYYPGNSNMGKRQLETLKDSKFGLFQSTGTASPTHWFNPGHIYGRYPGTRI
jgi:hypothetical protein